MKQLVKTIMYTLYLLGTVFFVLFIVAAKNNPSEMALQARIGSSYGLLVMTSLFVLVCIARFYNKTQDLKFFLIGLIPAALGSPLLEFS